MNCEQVFQHLASANPSSANGKLEQHLNSCSSCRQVADLFRPAVQLLASEPDEPALNEPSGERWPQIWEAVAVAEQAAIQLKRNYGNNRHRPIFSQPAAFAAVLLLGIAIGLGGATAWRSNSRASHPLTQPVELASGAARAHLCRYDRLLDEHLGLGLDLCANCRTKFDAELSNVITLCMVCHTKPADDVHARVGRELLVD